MSEVGRELDAPSLAAEQPANSIKGRPSAISYALNILTQTPAWYRGSLVLIFALFCICIIIAAVSTATGALNRDTANAWAALFATILGLSTLGLNHLASVMTAQDQRNQKTKDLAMALLAEVSSKLEQQLSAYDENQVRAKLSRIIKMELEPTFTIADEVDAIYTKALDHYEYIPSSSIESITKYYNLDNMLNKLNSALSSPEFAALSPVQKKTTLFIYYELSDKVIDNGIDAMRQLHQFLSKKSFDEDKWNNRNRFSKEKFKRETDEIEKLDQSIPSTATDGC